MCHYTGEVMAPSSTTGKQVGDSVHRSFGDVGGSLHISY